MNELTGSIKLIGETSEYGEKKFRKREFIVTTTGQYPQDIKLELYQNDCNLLDEYIIGDDVGVLYNIRGNEYKGKYYVNLQAWKFVTPTEEGSPTTSAPKRKRELPAQDPQPETTEDLAQHVEELSDAPF
mgnify:CR=1 FL=1|tara:strand:+ start:1261 stop:1650 length:390 start_codon:yes stop_codon:yes gene_type:complete